MFFDRRHNIFHLDLSNLLGPDRLGQTVHGPETDKITLLGPELSLDLLLEPGNGFADRRVLYTFIRNREQSKGIVERASTLIEPLTLQLAVLADAVIWAWDTSRRYRKQRKTIYSKEKETDLNILILLQNYAEGLLLPSSVAVSQ